MLLAGSGSAVDAGAGAGLVRVEALNLACIPTSATYCLRLHAERDFSDLSEAAVKLQRKRTKVNKLLQSTTHALQANESSASAESLRLLQRELDVVRSCGEACSSPLMLLSSNSV